MIRYFLIILTIICSFVISFSQEQNINSKITDTPKIVCLTLPNYPVSAEILGLEGKLTVSLQINQEGEIISTNFNNGLLFFQNRIKRVLKNWKFEKSDKEIREATINFEFILLPFDSESDVSAVFESPNTIKIYEKKRKLLDSTSH